MALTKDGLFKTLHRVLWVIWALLLLSRIFVKDEAAYNSVFGEYISYRYFFWAEFLFVSCGILLLLFFIWILPERMAYWAYIIFELFFLTIIVVDFVILFESIRMQD